MRSRLLPAAVLALSVALPSAARAQDAGAPPGGEPALAALDAEIDRALTALSADGCTVACQALASMHRAVARLCAAEPGPRCSEARARAQRAQRRVDGACGACAQPGMARRDPDASPPTDDEHRAPSPPPPAPPPPASPPSAGPVPARERAHGGCAGCEVGGEPAGPAAPTLALLGAALLVARRRRR
jgi:MYXO-CTERM domain-containing protein